MKTNDAFTEKIDQLIDDDIDFYTGEVIGMDEMITTAHSFVSSRFDTFHKKGLLNDSITEFYGVPKEPFRKRHPDPAYVPMWAR